MAGKPPGLSTPSSSAGTPTAASGSKRRRSSDKEEPESSSLSQPLADFVSAEPCTHEPVPQHLVKVQDICKNFPSLIPPPDAPARQQDLEVLSRKGFNFTINKQLGAGSFGAIYECTFSQQQPDGKEINKILACKKVAIYHPKRVGMLIERVEQQIQREMNICEMLIANQNKNIAKHELMWQIKDATIEYKNPIIHLIFMEKCEGSLKDFVIQNYGYSTAPNNYTGAVPEIVNKIWMYHVCQGLDFLHNQNKKNNQGNERWYSIIHHDLKHDNILYQMHGDRVKFMICDFGVSIVFEFPPDEDRDQTNIMSSRIAGSVRFFSPIVFQLKNDYDQWNVNRIGKFQTSLVYEARKKDVYALGVMLSDCLIGFVDPATSQRNSAHELADQWLHNSLRKSQPSNYLPLVQLNKVSHECITFMFKLANFSEIGRPLVSEVLTNAWFNEVRSTPTFVDYKAMSGLESGTKHLKTSP